MRSRIVQAFLAINDGWPADRVVADPELNERFQSQCQAFGVCQPPKKLNLALLNARKAGWLKGQPRSKRTSFSEEAEYRSAVEPAVRLLEQQEAVSLDEIICDPTLAVRFDAICEQILPGYSSLQYRWAALNLRKARKLKPELISRVVVAEEIRLGRVDGLDVSSIPVAQGIYVFYSPAETLYVGEAQNLRRRIEKHLDHSDNKGLARWFWAHGIESVFLELRVLPHSTATRFRRALEAELIQSRHPLFNCRMAVSSQ